MDGFRLDEDSENKFGFKWVFEIIDHFSKFWKSYAAIANNSQEALICLKDYCYSIGIAEILQTDNGLEYKNDLITGFCNKNNIKHIFSSPRHPKINGVVEMAHRETRKYIINKILENDKDYNLKIFYWKLIMYIIIICIVLPNTNL